MKLHFSVLSYFMEIKVLGASWAGLGCFSLVIGIGSRKRKRRRGAFNARGPHGDRAHPPALRTARGDRGERGAAALAPQLARGVRPAWVTAVH